MIVEAHICCANQQNVHGIRELAILAIRFDPKERYTFRSKSRPNGEYEKFFISFNQLHGNLKTTAPEEPTEDGPETTADFARTVVEAYIPPAVHTVIPVETSGHNFASSTTGTNRVYFSTMAPDTSDGVVEFRENVQHATDKEDISRPIKRTVGCHYLLDKNVHIDV